MFEKYDQTEQVKRLLFAREGSAVQRNHSTATINPATYTNGHHTHGMLVILFVLFPDLASLPLVQHITFHDVYENDTGDANGGAKIRWPALKQILDQAEFELEEEYQFLNSVGLSSFDKKLLKYIDRFELCLYCYEQLSLGNRSPKLRTMFERVKQAVFDIGEELDQVRPGHRFGGCSRIFFCEYGEKLLNESEV
jgi:hypothetical protein